MSLIGCVRVLLLGCALPAVWAMSVGSTNPSAITVAAADHGSPSSDSLSPAAYRTALLAIDQALAVGDREQARHLAAGLAGRTVAWPSGPLAADPSLLAAIEHEGQGAIRVRLATLVAELASMPALATGAGIAADPQALAVIRTREEATDLALSAGGALKTLHLQVDSELVPPSWWERLGEAVDWVLDRLREFWQWLESWFFDPQAKPESGGAGAAVPAALTVVGVLVVVAAVLVAFAWRRRKPVVATTPVVVAPEADADPRSRAADAWRRYAQELESQGRRREAVRAWYHALLVSCWTRGRLHHRIGRTNWEYAYALPGTLGWRSRFHELTRRFDLAWYGGHDDDSFGREADALLDAMTDAGKASAADADAVAGARAQGGGR